MPSDDDRDQAAPVPADEPALPVSLRPVGVHYRRMRMAPWFYAAPVLPTPQELVDYKAAVREAPMAILMDFLEEGKHRRALEAQMVRDEQARLIRGQWFALVVMLAGMLLSARLVQAGHDWAGTALAGGNLVAMGALFVRTRRGRAGGDRGVAQR